MAVGSAPSNLHGDRGRIAVGLRAVAPRSEQVAILNRRTCAPSVWALGPSPLMPAPTAPPPRPAPPQPAAPPPPMPQDGGQAAHHGAASRGRRLLRCRRRRRHGGRSRKRSAGGGCAAGRIPRCRAAWGVVRQARAAPTPTCCWRAAPWCRWRRRWTCCPRRGPPMLRRGPRGLQPTALEGASPLLPTSQRR